MKNILLIILAMFAFQMQAQLNEAMAEVDDTVVHTKVTKVEKSFSARYNVIATEQIQKNVAEKVQYPEIMHENLIEGLVVIKLRMKGNGEIIKSEIVKSSHNLFKNAVTNVMDQIHFIDTQGGKFGGVHTIHVPIKFTIE